MRPFDTPIYTDRISLEEAQGGSGRDSAEVTLLDKEQFRVEIEELDFDSHHHRHGSWIKRVKDCLSRRKQRRRFDRTSATCESCDSPQRRKRYPKLRMFIKFFVVSLSIIGLLSVVEMFLGFGGYNYPDEYQERQWWPHWGEPGEPGDGLAHYPTDFTRDIIPIPCHSHNDYWRRIPLFEGIHYGCTGTEADVWLFDEELYVGHTPAALTKNRTFRNLYVDPLVKILDNQNRDTPFSHHTRNGVFDEEPDRTLVFLVDFKNDGSAIFPYVHRQIEALRKKNYLTYFNGTDLVEGPVTVVATGNAPFNLVNESGKRRDIFFDAPLDAIRLAALTSKSTVTPNAGQGTTGVDLSAGSSQFTRENSYYASTNFGASIGFPWRMRLSDKQRRLIREQIRAAHAKGLKARYWNTPAWPIGLRNHVWRVLVQEGADYLNVDDLRGAARADWRRARDRDW